MSSLTRSALLLGRTPELGLRALLRNLRLLKGLREREVLDVVVAGAESPSVASLVASLEPALRVVAVGDGSVGAGIDVRAFAGKSLAGLIVCQPLHALRAPATELADIRRALDAEEGALGFVWTRAQSSGAGGWVDAFTRAAAGPTSRPSFASALEWCDALNVQDFGFLPLKHRKFVEKYSGERSCEAYLSCRLGTLIYHLFTSPPTSLLRLS